LYTKRKIQQSSSRNWTQFIDSRGGGGGGRACDAVSGGKAGGRSNRPFSQLYVISIIEPYYVRLLIRSRPLPFSMFNDERRKVQYLSIIIDFLCLRR
jgi:hypothetical protein